MALEQVLSRCIRRRLDKCSLCQHITCYALNVMTLADTSFRLFPSSAQEDDRCELERGSPSHLSNIHQ